MADEIRVTREEGTPGARPVGEVRPSPADPARQPPPEAAAPVVPDYDDPEQARADIEATRARMSETIDEIEGALIRRKERIQDRLDVLSPIRENPFPSMGIAFGTGLIFGLLTGGDDDDDEDYDYDDASHDSARSYTYAPAASYAYASRSWEGDDDDRWERRARAWKNRSHRLLDIARAQEDELASLREDRTSRRARGKAHRDWDDDDDHGEDWHAEESGLIDRSTLDSLRSTISRGVSGLVSAAIREFLGSSRK